MNRFFALLTTLFVIAINPSSAADTVVLPLEMTVGWNLVSFPLEPVEADLSVLFDGKMRGQMWTFIDGEDVAAEQIEPGRSYWVQLTAPLRTTYRAQFPADRSVSGVDVNFGWNMVGPFSPVGIPDEIDSIWRFRLRRYLRDGAVLGVGRGYFMRATETGTVDLGAVDQDLDADSVYDFWEAMWGLDHTDPADADSDTDTDDLTALGEFNAGTNPTVADTDGDSFLDGFEVQATSDPTDDSSVPIVPLGLVFTQQPTDGVVGTALSAVEVSAQDASGQTAPWNTSVVTLDLGVNPTGATLIGNLTQTAVAGVARFDNLFIDNTGTGFALRATTTDLITAFSTPFSITELPAPESVVALPDDQSLLVGWSSVAGATSYNVYLSTTSGVNSGNAEQSFSNVTSPFAINSVTNDTPYFLVVVAEHGSVGGTASAEVTGTPSATPSTTETQFVSGRVSAGTVRNATGTLSALSSEVRAENEVATVTTDANGDYTAIVSPPRIGQLRFRFSTGQTIDPITGDLAPFSDSLEAVFVADGGHQTQHISPLTTMASRLLEAVGGVSDPSVVDAVNQAVDHYFGTSAPATPLDLSNATDAAVADTDVTSPSVRLAVVLAGLAQLASTRSLSLAGYGHALADDAIDGAFDGRSTTTTITGVNRDDMTTGLASAIEAFLASDRNLSTIASSDAYITDLLGALKRSQGTVVFPARIGAPVSGETDPADGASVADLASVVLEFSDPDGLDEAASELLIWRDGTALTENADWSRSSRVDGQITVSFSALEPGTYDIRVTPHDVLGNHPFVPVRVLLTAGETRALSVSIALPGALSPSDYFVASPVDGVDYSSGSVDVSMKTDQVNVIAAIPNNDNDQVFWAVATEGQTDLSINATSTAIALMLMAPGLLSSGAVDVETLMDIAAGLPETAILVTQIDAVWPTSSSPLDDAGVQSALRDAIVALLDSLPRADTGARSARMEPEPPLPVRTRRNADKIIVESLTAQPGLQLSPRPLNEMDWLARAIRLDPVTNAPATGDEAYNNIILMVDTEAFDGSTSLTEGLAASIAEQFTFLDNTDGQFELADEAGLYQLRLFSGAIVGDFSAFTDQDMTDWANATVINVLAPTIEGVGILTDKLDLSVMQSTLVQELTVGGILTAPGGSRSTGDPDTHSIILNAIQKAVIAGVQAALVDEPIAKVKKYLTKAAGTMGKLSNFLSALGEVISTFGTTLMVAKRVTVLNGGSFLPFLEPHSPSEFITVEVGDINAAYLASITPATAFANETVTIMGKGFSTSAGDRTVSVAFGNVLATDVTIESATELTVTVPYGVAGGETNIAVTIDGKTFVREAFFTMERSPSITSITPDSGFPASSDFQGESFSGTRLTIVGNGFEPTTNDLVTIGGASASIIVGSSTSTGLVVRVPEDATTGPVQVSRRDGDDNVIYASNTIDFTVAAAPTITDISPSGGPVGTPLLITGTNFGTSAGNVKVLFVINDGSRAVETVAGTVRHVDDTELTVTVPAISMAGDVSVNVVTPVGSTAMSAYALDRFEVTPGAASGGLIVITSFGADDNDGDITFNEAVAYADAGTTTVQADGDDQNDDDTTIIVADLPPDLRRYTITDIDGDDTDIFDVTQSFYTTTQRSDYEQSLDDEVTSGNYASWSVTNVDDDRDSLGGLTVNIGDTFANSIFVTPGLTGTVDGFTFDMDHDSISAEGATLSFTGGVVVAAENSALLHATITGGVTYTAAPTDAKNTTLDTVTITGDVILSTDSNRFRDVEITGMLTVSGNDNDVVLTTLTHAAGVGVSITGNANTVGGVIRDCGSHGVEIVDASANRVEGAVVLANAGSGVRITGATSVGNEIRVCDIGWNAGTSTAEGNGGDGIEISGGRDHFVYYTDILSNTGNGILIDGSPGNRVEQTFVGSWEDRGATEFGSAAMFVAGNGGHGVLIKDADRNIIGDRDDSDRDNRINGNSMSGIKIEGNSADNVLFGNSIGKASLSSIIAPHVHAIGNGIHGIDVTGDGIVGTIIDDNSIAANALDGIHLEDITAASGVSVTVDDNSLVKFEGKPNERMGIFVKNTARALLTDNSVIDHPVGVIFEGDTCADNTMRGGLIAGCMMGGLGLNMGAHDNTFSHLTVVATIDGPGIVVAGSNDNTFLEMTAQDDNAFGDMIIDGGSTNTVVHNLAFGSSAVNLAIVGDGTENVTVTGCEFSSDESPGMVIAEGAQTITIGGLEPDERNRFHVSGSGISISGAGTHNIDIIGNEFDGGEHGVMIADGAHDIRIGDGTDSRGRNVFSSADPHVLIDGIVIVGPGSTGITIENNMFSPIGRVEQALMFNSMPTGDGIRIESISGSISDPPVVIGGDHDFSANIISGVEKAGIRIKSSSGIQISNNQLGPLPFGLPVDASSEVQPNLTGILFELGASGNQALGNMISAATEDGVQISGAGSDANTISNNFIGQVPGTPAPFRNGRDGVAVLSSAQGNLITRNIIAGNGRHGTLIDGSVENRILANRIFQNVGAGIALEGGGNTAIPAPTITNVQKNSVSGTIPDSITGVKRVEVFADGGNQGQQFIGSRLFSGDTFRIKAPIPQGLNITATVTDNDGNTSAFGGTATPGSPAYVNASSGFTFTSTHTANADIYAGALADLTGIPRVTDSGDDDMSFNMLSGPIVFVSDRSGNLDLWKVDADGGNPVQLTHDAGDNVDPSVSADGTTVAFASNRDGNTEIYVMAIDGSVVTQLTMTAGDVVNRHPAWSPDGTRIAFASGTIPRFSPRTMLTIPPFDAEIDIFTMTATGTGQTNITPDSVGPDTQPTWSPDGADIAFASARTGNFDIHLVEPTGANVRQVTTSPAQDIQPAWASAFSGLTETGAPDVTTPVFSVLLFTSDRDTEFEVFGIKTDGTLATRLTQSRGVAVAPNAGY